MDNKSVKRAVIYYHLSPGACMDNAQVVSELNNIRNCCIQCGWKPANTFIDRSVPGSMYPAVKDYAADPANAVSVIIRYTAGDTTRSSFTAFDDTDDMDGTLVSEECPANTDNKSKPFNSVGGIPYGYVIDNGGGFAIDINKAAVIKEIFESKAGDCSLQRIADTLNNRGVKSARGGEWSKAAISFILKNPAYIGSYQYKASHKDGEISYKIPPIISEQLFNKANGLN